MLDEFREEIDPIVFAFGALLTVGVIAAFFISPSAVENGISSLNNQLLGAFNWAMMLIVFLIVLFLLFLIVGPWGGIKFGDEPPSTVSSPFCDAVLRGVRGRRRVLGPTEALFYYNNPSPLFSNIEGGTAEAMTVAVQQTLFHWALPQLAVFTIMGIAIGYFAYNYDNVPLRVSSALTPILGADNLDGPAAKVVDILAVFATIGGVATSLGFIGSQFVTGLDYQWGSTWAIWAFCSSSP